MSADRVELNAPVPAPHPSGEGAGRERPHHGSDARAAPHLRIPGDGVHSSHCLPEPAHNQAQD